MFRSSILLCCAAGALVAQGWPLPPNRTGNLYVSGFSSGNLGEFTKAGVLVRTFQHPTMINPRGVAVDDDGNVIVVVQAASRILRFDPDGALLQTVTHPDLTSGTGIGRSPSGLWYVGNFSPGRVVVFDAQWTHVGTLTAPGLSGVNCVSFDGSGDGTFAVTSASSGFVYRFDSAHVPFALVSHPNFLSPMSIAEDASGNHYVSNGSSGWVVKFDPAWNPLFSFGLGTLSQPQGIAVDENDELTISNFAAQTIHRYDPQGQLLGSFALQGVQVGRNIAWQTHAPTLARAGVVGTGTASDPEDVLRVNGLTGDARRRVSLGPFAPFSVSLTAPTSGPSSAGFVLYALLVEPAAVDLLELPGGLGLLSFAPPVLGGVNALVLANSLGLDPILGSGLIPSSPAPHLVLSLPNGLGFPATITMQGLIEDSSSPSTLAGVPWSVTNAVVAVLR